MYWQNLSPFSDKFFSTYSCPWSWCHSFCLECWTQLNFWLDVCGFQPVRKFSGADTLHKMYKKAHEILSKKMVSRMVYIYLLEAYAFAKCDWWFAKSWHISIWTPIYEILCPKMLSKIVHIHLRPLTFLCRCKSTWLIHLTIRYPFLMGSCRLGFNYAFLTLSLLWNSSLHASNSSMSHEVLIVSLSSAYFHLERSYLADARACCCWTTTEERFNCWGTGDKLEKRQKTSQT